VKATNNQRPVSTANNTDQSLIPSNGIERPGNMSLPFVQKLSANLRPWKTQHVELESNSHPSEGRIENAMNIPLDSTPNLERLTLTTEEVMKVTGWSREIARARIGTPELPNVGTRRRFLASRAHLRRFLGERP
jgi:hypothetical protein